MLHAGQSPSCPTSQPPACNCRREQQHFCFHHSQFLHSVVFSLAEWVLLLFSLSSPVASLPPERKSASLFSDRPHLFWKSWPCFSPSAGGNVSCYDRISQGQGLSICACSSLFLPALLLLYLQRTAWWRPYGCYDELGSFFFSTYRFAFLHVHRPCDTIFGLHTILILKKWAAHPVLSLLLVQYCFISRPFKGAL